MASTSNSNFFSKRPDNFGIAFIAYGIIAVIIIVAFWQFIPTDRENLLPMRVRTERVATCIFENRTGDPQFNTLGLVIADWVPRVLLNGNFAKTALPANTRHNNYLLKNLPGDYKVFTQATGVKYLITGYYEQRGDSLRLMSYLIDGLKGDTITTFKTIQAEKEQQSLLLQQFTGDILSHWTQRDLDEINPAFPNIAAYNTFIKGLQASDKSQANAKQYFSEAFQQDDQFYTPLLALTAWYREHRAFEEADSILAICQEHISPYSQFEVLQTKIHDAFLKGDVHRGTDYYQQLYELDPHNPIAVKQAGYYHLVYKNDPRYAIEIFSAYESEKSRSKTATCLDCQVRDAYKAAAHKRLDQHDAILELVEAYTPRIQSGLLADAHINALVDLEKWDELENTLSKYRDIPLYEAGTTRTALACDFAAMLACMAKDQPQYAKPSAELILSQTSSEATPTNDQYRGLAHYVLGNYKQAAKRAESLLQFNPYHQYAFPAKLLYLSYLKRNEKAEGERLLEIYLPVIEVPYSFGELAYIDAIVAAHEGAQRESLELLKEAFTKGKAFDQSTFLHDFAFVSMKDYSPLQQWAKPR